MQRCFSRYSLTTYWAENEWIWSVLANRFSTNNLLGACQEIIMVISKKQTNKCKEKLVISQSIGIMVIKSKETRVITYTCRYSSGHLIPIIQSCQGKLGIKCPLALDECAHWHPFKKISSFLIFFFLIQLLMKIFWSRNFPDLQYLISPLQMLLPSVCGCLIGYWCVHQLITTNTL